MRQSRSRVVVWSVVLHGIAIAALWAVLTGEPQPIQDETSVIAVDLVALAQSAPAAPAGGPAAPEQPDPASVSPPTAARPAPPPPPEPPVERRPTPTVKPEKAPKQPLEKPAPSTPSPPAPAPPAQTPGTAAPSNPAPSTATQTTGSGAAPGQPNPETSAIAKASYARLVLSRLQRAIVYPRRAQRREIEGVVRVEIVLAASGALRKVRLLGSSGSDILDDAALELVRRVAPFPAVPQALSPRGQDVAFTAPIQYRLN